MPRIALKLFLVAHIGCCRLYSKGRNMTLGLCVLSLTGCIALPDLDPPDLAQDQGTYPSLKPYAEVLSDRDRIDEIEISDQSLIQRAEALRRKAAALRAKTP